MESRHECRRPVLKYEQLSNYRALRDRMLALRRAGMSTAQIAERLNSEGFHTPDGADRFSRHISLHIFGAAGSVGPRDDEAGKSRRASAP